MSYFEFPHTRTYDSDLGWLIRAFKQLNVDLDNLQEWADTHKPEYEELREKVEGLINHLVDVIVPWDSSVEYPIYSIVEYQGTNYIAIRPVPVGAMITNEYYWQEANTVVEQINAIGHSVDEVREEVEEVKGEIIKKIVSPFDFEASGDGITDDTAAVQSAINYAQENGALLRIDGDFLTSTLLIAKGIRIEGPGTLRQMPFYYTTLTAPVSAGGTVLTVADASRIHVNQTIIIDGDMLTVEGIEGNTVTVSHYCLNNRQAGTMSAHSAGDTVRISNSVLCVAKTLGYDATPTPNGLADVSGLSIRNVEFAGSKSGYDSTKYNYTDLIAGYLLLFYRVENSAVVDCSIHDGPVNAFAIMGYADNIRVEGCDFYGIDGSLYTTPDAIESNAGILIHWDPAIIDEANRAFNVSIDGCAFDRCVYGVFASGASYSHINGNSFLNCVNSAIHFYFGDRGFPTVYNVISNNSILSENSHGISLYGVGDTTIVGNTINASGCIHVMYSAARLLIASNLLRSLTRVLHFTGTLLEVQLQSNSITMNGAGTMAVFESDVTGTLKFENNRWLGSGTSTILTSTISLASLDTYFINEAFINCRGLRLTGGTLHVWNCVANGLIFLLMAERNAADVFNCREGNNDYSTLGYRAGTTAQKTAINPVAPGMLFFDTTLQKLCVYTGSAWATIA